MAERDTRESSEYLTLASESRAVLREKMSKFIAIAFPVSSPDDAKRRIKGIANEYHDARHVCWAYVTGAAGQDSMSNDNGEPSGTAGRPILGQIRSAGLTYVAVAVVRYFGGIKLGTSGLIEAYRDVTREALAEGEKITRTEETVISLTFPYANIESVMRTLKSFPARILRQDFQLNCVVEFSIRKDCADEILARLDGSVTVGSSVGNSS